MPISESDYSYDDATNDHYDFDNPHHQVSSSAHSNSNNRMMSKAELRKTHKPIMEKRRRAKINNCLNEIKDLILSAMKKDPERHSKLEKADILEMAVKHLKTVQKQQKEIAIRTDPTLALKYKSGYLECASEVSTYVDQIEGTDPGLKQRLTNHLNKCANTLERPQFDFTSSSLLASFAAQSRFNDDQNNNGRNHLPKLPTMQGIELIPSCLPNGDFAFLVPKSSFSSILEANSQDTNVGNERTSAFVTVMPRGQSAQHAQHAQNGLLTIAKPLSPPISPEMPKIIKPKAVPGNVGTDKIHSIKFPINTNKKEHEPLCIITNNGERFRQAQRVEESKHMEENSYSGLNLNKNYNNNHTQISGSTFNSLNNLKRKAEGLLTVANVPMKYPRVELELPTANVSAFKSFAGTAAYAQDKESNTIYECISSDDEDDEIAINHNNDNNEEPMWRPW